MAAGNASSQGNATIAARTLSPDWFFDLSRTAHRELLEGRRFVWDAVRDLEDYVREKARRQIKGQV